MAEKRPALGRGLSALIPDTAPPPRAVVVERERPLELDIDRLTPNARQPRHQDRKSTRLNSSHSQQSRMPSSA